MGLVSTRAGQMFYEDHGSGVPVVMLHATLHDHHDFDAIAKRLAVRYRVIAVDWPGHGRSDPRRIAAITAPRLADALEDLVRELDLSSAIFVGNSIGGYAAARLAISQPERVRALVLVNTAGFARVTTLGRAFARLLGKPAVARRLLPRLVRGYMKPRNATDGAIAERVIARARTSAGAVTAATLWRSFTDPEYDLRPRAGEIAAPTLLVWGAKDTILPLKAGRETHQAIPGSRLEVLETGHVVFASDPDRFLALVEPFIASALHASENAVA